VLRESIFIDNVPFSQYINALHPRFVHPVALAINKKNEPPLFATVFVVLSILLHVSAYIGHPQVLRTQNVKKNRCMQH
jgi:hypothetical protein